MWNLEEYLPTGIFSFYHVDGHAVTNVTTTNKEGKVQSFIKNNPCVIVHHCTKFGRKRTQHRSVIGINNNYKFLLPDAVCFCLQIVISVMMKTCHST